jgi:hypothetical protein
MKTIRIAGIELAEYTDCPRCKKKEACRFKRFAYEAVCIDCQNSKEYQDEQEKKDKIGSINNAFRVNKPAAIWEGRGRHIVTNYKGDIIADVPAKPRPLGRKDWKL